MVVVTIRPSEYTTAVGLAGREAELIGSHYTVFVKVDGEIHHLLFNEIQR